MDTHCTVCRAALREGDLDRERQFVSCSTCGSMFTLRKSDAARRSDDVAAQERLPGKYWSYERAEDVVRLSWRWYGPETMGLALLALGVILATLPVAFGWVTPRKSTREEALHLAIATILLIGYPTLISFFNRTRIEASPGTGLKIRHGPLPWFFLPRTLKLRDIQQLYGQRKKHKHKGHIRYTYELRVQRPDGKTRHLVGSGLTAEEVLFLERTLERHLGIEDRAVPGDFKPEGSA